MPELPDVEGYRRVLTTHLVGEVVRQVEVLDDSVIRNSTRRCVEATVGGRILVRVDRRGKWLIAALGGPALVFHFGMTGALLATACGATRSRFDRMVLVATAEVRYRDVHKLGGVWLTEDEAAIDDIIGPQGPDARAVSHSELTGRLGPCGQDPTHPAVAVEPTRCRGPGLSTLWRSPRSSTDRRAHRPVLPELSTMR